MLVSWTETPGAVKYLIYLNGNYVGTAPAGVTEFKITKAMGYNPNAPSKQAAVKPQMADGTIGDGVSNQPPTYSGSGWGFTALDILVNVMTIIGTLSLFILLAIAVKIVPNIIALIMDAARP